MLARIMLSRIKRSPRKYAIYAGVAALIVAGYMLQARTTIEVRSHPRADRDIIICWHAHFKDHDKRHTAYEFPFIRHYHRDSYVVSCDDYPERQWRTAGRWQRFDVRPMEASDKWPDLPGVYVFVKRMDEQEHRIYVGHTTNLKETLSNPFEHEEWSCLDENGPPTHIYAREHRGSSRRADERDAASLIAAFAPPVQRQSRKLNRDIS